MDELDTQGLGVMRDLSDFADEMQGKLTTPQAAAPDECAQVVYLAFFVRAKRIFRAFRILIEQCLGPEAQLLMRPFLETLVDWLYIETKPDELGPRYLLHQAAAQLQFFRDEGRIEDERRHLAKCGDSVQEFCKLYSINNGKLPREWCAKNMNGRATEAGVDSYYTLYTHHSRLLHNDPTSLAYYLTFLDSNSLLLNTEPDLAHLEPLVAIMSSAFLLCIEKTNTHFQLQAELGIAALEAETHAYCLESG